MSTMDAVLGWPALDRDLVRQRLEQHLRPDCLMRSLIVRDVRFRPKGRTWLLYRLDMAQPAGQSAYVSGLLLHPGESPPEPPASLVERYHLWPDRVLGEPWLVDPALSLALYAYPVDAAMPSLFDANDVKIMRRALAPFSPQASIKSVRCRNRSYSPHARATFAYDVRTKNGAEITHHWIGKTQAGKPAAERSASHEGLWSLAEGRLPIPRPLGYLDSLDVALQEHVPGERLGALVDRPGFDDLLGRTADALATLHGFRLPTAQERRPKDEVKTVKRWSEILQAIRPDLSGRIGTLERALTRAILEQAQVSALIHADFHHTNVLVEGDRLTFIDLDELAMGDPMLDVGRFIASLRIPALRAFGEASALDGAADAFLEAYARHGQGNLARVHVFESASLLIAAGSSFRLQRERWPEEVEILLEASERRLKDGRRPPLHRTFMEPTAPKSSVPRVLRDLYYALAKRSRGVSLVLGPDGTLLARELEAHGHTVAQAARPDDLRHHAPESLTTVVIWNLLERLEEPASQEVLREAWERVRPGGRLVAAVPNGRSKWHGVVRRMSRRRLRRELRALGRPELATDQPYEWVVMIVRKPESGRPALSRTDRLRARVTAKLCRGKVIDLGCGEGHLAGLIAEKGHPVLAIDKNRQKIRIARSLYPNVDFRTGDIRNLHLAPESFDTAVLAEVLEHLSEAEGAEALASAMQLLKRGGRLVVSVPNEDCVPHRNHLQEFDRFSLRRLLAPFGRTRLITEQPFKWLLMVVEKS